jgi:ribosome-associated protein
VHAKKLDPKTSPTNSSEAKELARKIAGFLHQKHATDIAILDVSIPLTIADCFVIATARNARHAHAVGNELGLWLKQLGRQRRNPVGTEGETQWVLVDFDDVVVHLFEPQARAFYDLEGLWADAPRLEWTPPPAATIRGSDSIEPL